MGILIAVAALIASIYFFAQTETFGAHPSGERLARIEKSPNYKNGAFQNLSPTPVQSENFSYIGTLWKYLNSSKYTEPSHPLPFVKTDLNTLPSQPTIVWFGHSSYLLKIEGKTILVDPVFSGSASPLSFSTKSFRGANTYSVSDLPNIDIVLITHDHYDHLDYKTILELKAKANLFCTSLGVGAHLERWGVDPKRIIEFDWWESKPILNSFQLTAAPARHFSGRGFKRYKSLWSSFILKTTSHTVYLGGDSGYDDHFKTIGEKYGPFDIALLECGQYNEGWPLIHMMPEETVQAAIDLKAAVLMPVHWGKFKLSLHPWKEPIERVSREALSKNVRITSPKIGEPVLLNAHYPQSQWWKEVD